MPQSKAELTIDKQILYLVQWFSEFSDFQRSDFLADHLLLLYGAFLKEKLLQPKDYSGLNGNVDGTEDSVMEGENGPAEDVVTNGVGAIDLSSRPPSIFQCRMKLFTDWSAQWSENDRLEFLLRLRNIDSTFLSEFYRLFLHRNSVNSYSEFEGRVKPDTEDLLSRLDINEKVFESKLPEVLAPAKLLNPLNSIGHCPDLLNDVVGIKCDSMETDPSLDVSPTEELVSEPTIQEPMIQEPVIQEQVTQEPVNQEPITQEPVTQEPVIQEPATQEPVTQEPVTQEPVTQEPVTQEPLIQEPQTRVLETVEPSESTEPIVQEVEELLVDLTVDDHITEVEYNNQSNEPQSDVPSTNEGIIEEEEDAPQMMITNILHNNVTITVTSAPPPDLVA